MYQVEHVPVTYSVALRWAVGIEVQNDYSCGGGEPHLCTAHVDSRAVICKLDNISSIT